MQTDTTARLSDLVYERLRDAIIALEIAPGSPIDEGQVRTRLGYGLTPIRDALKRLAHDRLVAIYPRRGTFAAEINIADDRWISEIRAELEGLAAALAAERATPEERANLTALAAQMRSTHTIADFISLDARFHRALYRAAHNPLLEANLAQHFNLALRIWNFTVRNFAWENVLMDDFETIAAAINQRDSQRARQAARQHTEYSRRIASEKSHSA